MTYDYTIEINLSREEVIKKFDSAENLFKWQPTLVSFDHIEGDPGQLGAKSKLIYKMGKREVEMIETITKRNLPDEFFGTYEAKGVWNEVKNYFKANGDKTIWTLETTFVCSGLMKLMQWLTPGMFKKQTLKMMNQFKDFAEEKSEE